MHGDGPCPVMRACGGCAWLNLPYRKQLARKQAAMEELFAPLLSAHAPKLALDPIQGMGGTCDDGKLPAPRAFRHKAATPFAPTVDGGVSCGFFARGTHDIVAVPSCAVEAPGARAILNGVAAAAQDLGISAYNEDTHQGLLRYAVLRLGWRSAEGVLTLVTSRRDVPHLDELAERAQQIDPRITVVAQNVNPRVTNAILGGETRILRGPDHMADSLLGCTFCISPTAFYQTNPEQTEVLYQLAIDGMDLRAGDVLMDAYCGSGTIGLCAAAAMRERGRDIRLLGVERNPAGIADARRNAELNGLSNAAEFLTRDATDYMLEAAARGERVDVLSIDPPRAGSTPEFLGAAAALAPRRIVYVSCNPETQARDLEQLLSTGYELLRLTPVDMFPHTEHVETVAVLERQG
nr:23S rRNA (uracil(1939)-C(5))-methyltransferase RlmD [Collinsella sp. D33t1_170424_A12]